MSHTKEPWSYQASIPEEGYECFWIISRCRQISSFDGPQNDEQFSNVRRIVACVNACAGISQQYLEELNGETIAERQLTLIKQRDELLACLELLYSWANNWDSEFMNDPDWKNRDFPRIQSAVASVKGQQ